MRDCECTVPRVPGDATRRLNDHISARLEPYDLEKALTFSPEYLSGFYTDRYDVPAAEIAAVAKRKSNDAVKEEMMSDVPKTPGLLRKNGYKDDRYRVCIAASVVHDFSLSGNTLYRGGEWADRQGRGKCPIQQI